MVARLIPGLLVSLALVACSSSSATPTDAGPVDASYDAAIGPLYCGIPVASTCTTTAPCSFTSLGCSNVPACDGYFVVTDGTWTYFYSAYGDALQGETLNAAVDGGLAECPYAFVPPPCTPTSLDSCDADAAPAEAGPSADAGTDASPDAGSVADAANDAPSDAPDDDGG